MKIQEITETARDLLDGVIYDADAFTVADCNYIADGNKERSISAFHGWH